MMMVVDDMPMLLGKTFVSGVLAFALGLVWYYPTVLGNKWMEIRQRADNSVGKSAQTSFPFVFSFMLWMLAAVFYTFMAGFHGVDSIQGFLCLSSLLWVAFAMPPTLMGALYTGYPFQAAAIDSAYQLAGYYIFALVHALIDYLTAA